MIDVHTQLKPTRSFSRLFQLTVLAGALSLAACDTSPTLTVKSLANPLSAGTRLPHVSTHPDGAVVSWVEQHVPEQLHSDAAERETRPVHTLRYSHVNADGRWNDAIEIASGSNWFVNWADFPGVYARSTGGLSAHWLQRSGQSTYAYDVVSTQSDNGIDWNPPRVIHLDGTQTEHGFVSYFSYQDQTAMVWLDGRNTKAGVNGHADHSHSDGDAGDSAMTLRSRTLSASSDTLSMSTLLDARVCDCCQTAAVNAADGAVVFYRDRSDAEIRDIAYVRQDQQTGDWSTPKILHEDGWQINGCPVNGPQADASGNTIAVAWFTAMPTARVMATVSTDGGRIFSAPTVVSRDRVLGRVDVVMLDANRFLVSFLESDAESDGEDSASIQLALFNSGLVELDRTTVASVEADRRSGFPRMSALGKNSALLAWTRWQDDQSAVATATVTAR